MIQDIENAPRENIVAEMDRLYPLVLNAEELEYYSRLEQERKNRRVEYRTAEEAGEDMRPYNNDKYF